MDKKVIVEFNMGIKYEISELEVVKLIADRFFKNENQEQKINEMIDDTSIIHEFIWELPWVDLMPHIPELTCGRKPACLCLAWKRAEAKVRVE